jgi:hypothetical protein
LNKVSRIDEVFSNRSPRDKASLFQANKEGDEPSKPNGEAFSMELKAAILMRDRSKIVRSIGSSFLREKDNVGFINGAEVGVE